MSLQKTISKTDIAKAIKEFYDFCSYEISDKQVIELSKLVLVSHEKLTPEEFYKFIYSLKLGELGMVYKTPISFMVAFNNFKEEKLPPIIKIKTGEFNR